jgi:hypothetical protein
MTPAWRIRGISVLLAVLAGCGGPRETTVSDGRSEAIVFDTPMAYVSPCVLCGWAPRARRIDRDLVNLADARGWTAESLRGGAALTYVRSRTAFRVQEVVRVAPGGLFALGRSAHDIVVLLDAGGATSTVRASHLRDRAGWLDSMPERTRRLFDEAERVDLVPVVLDLSVDASEPWPTRADAFRSRLSPDLGVVDVSVDPSAPRITARVNARALALLTLARADLRIQRLSRADPQ